MLIRPIVWLVKAPFRLVWYLLVATGEAFKWALIVSNPIFLLVYLYQHEQKHQKEDRKP